jgi:hypothetical protein
MDIHENEVKTPASYSASKLAPCPACGSLLVDTGRRSCCPRCFFTVCLSCEGEPEPDG